MITSTSFLCLSLVFAAFGAQAETHSVEFVNNCGFGTPTLVQNGNVLSTGAVEFTINGPLVNAIAYLQAGTCGLNGENCTVVETTLMNPTSPGNGSATDISISPPHKFSGSTGFGYFNGCDGEGEDCVTPTCPTPFLGPGEPRQVLCQEDNVNLAITFCD